MSEKVKPITPDEVFQEIPDWVIEGANNCIRKHWVELNQESRFLQEELIEEIWKIFNKKIGTADYKAWKDKLFENHYLDIEPIYRKAGWNVVYDSPAYCENYKPNFTFRKEK